LNASVGRNYLSAPNPVNEQALGHAVVLVYESAAKASPTELSCLSSLPRTVSRVPEPSSLPGPAGTGAAPLKPFWPAQKRFLASTAYSG